jgi:hypothetical protein
MRLFFLLGGFKAEMQQWVNERKLR